MITLGTRAEATSHMKLSQIICFLRAELIVPCWHLSGIEKVPLINGNIPVGQHFALGIGLVLKGLEAGGAEDRQLDLF